jgi:cytochrome c oxidase subunit 2
MMVALAGLLLAGGAASAQGQDGGLWLPYSASSYSAEIDFMYIVIFWVTTGMFVLTNGLLFAFCVIYRRRPGHRSTYTHGNHTAELAWTVTPALMLLGLAVWQIPAWNKAKLDFPKPGDANVTRLQIIGEQFKWNFRYPVTKEQQSKYASEYAYIGAGNGPVFMPFGDKMIADLRSKDVIHSFFVPHMRVKQDAVPGMRNRVWFEPNRIPLINLKATPTGTPGGAQPMEWSSDPKEFEANGKLFGKRIAFNKYFNKVNKDPQGELLFTTQYVPGNEKAGAEAKVWAIHEGKVIKDAKWGDCDYAIGIFDVACAELCGLGHYTMNAYLYVVPRPAFEAWITDQADGQDDPTEKAWKRWHD